MITIYVLIITGLVGMLAYRFLRTFITPYSYSQMKKVKENETYDDSKEFDFDKFQRKASRKLPIVNMSEDLAQDVEKKIGRLGLDTTVKDIRKLQLLYFISALVLAILARVVFGGLIAGIIAIMSLYAWRYPLLYIDSKIQERDEAIKIELPEMYAVLYYVYRRSASVNLTSKVQSYIKDSSDLFYKEMMLFIEDSRNGEQYALRQFKNRVPLGVVSRFCEIMSQRLEGYDNIATMEGFKKEMDDKRLAREEKILQDLRKKLETISWIGIMIPMGIILCIYFAAQLMATLI